MNQPTLLEVRSIGLTNSLIRINKLLNERGSVVCFRVNIGPSLKILSYDPVNGVSPSGELIKQLVTLPSDSLTGIGLTDRIINWAYSYTRGDTWLHRIKGIFGEKPLTPYDTVPT